MNQQNEFRKISASNNELMKEGVNLWKQVADSNDRMYEITDANCELEKIKAEM